MTLFDDLKKVPLKEESELHVAIEDASRETLNLPNEIAQLPTQEESDINFADAIGKIAQGSGEETPVSLIKGLSRSEDAENEAKNMAMKAIIPNIGAYTAAQFLADWNDSLGLSPVADALRNLCDWQYHHSCGYKGERSKQAFAALNEQEQKEFLLQKEAKGIIPR